MEIKNQCFLAITRSLYNKSGDDYDESPYLEFTAFELAVYRKLLVEQAPAWHKKMSELYSYGTEAGLSTKHTDGLMYANQMEQIARGGYIEVTGVTLAIASTDLTDLVTEGFLTLEERIHDRVYRPVPVERARESSTGNVSDRDLIFRFTRAAESGET